MTTLTYEKLFNSVHWNYFQRFPLPLLRKRKKRFSFSSGFHTIHFPKNNTFTNYPSQQQFYNKKAIWKNCWSRTLKTELVSKIFKKCYQTNYRSGSPILISETEKDSSCWSKKISSGKVLLVELQVIAADLYELETAVKFSMFTGCGKITSEIYTKQTSRTIGYQFTLFTLVWGGSFSLYVC